MGSENGLTRPPLDQWIVFSKALRELLSAAGVNKLGLARTLQLDRRVVGAIVEGREPCPESFLIRLYERDHDGLGRSQHLSALVALWSEASGSAPATLIRLMSRGEVVQEFDGHAGVGGPPDRRTPAPSRLPASGGGGGGSAVDPGELRATVEAEAAPRRDRRARAVVIAGLAATMLLAGVLLLNDRSTPGGDGAAQASTAQGVTRTIQIYNKVTSGGKEMSEDSVAFLSSKPANYCRRDGCVLDGTDVLSTGDSVTAVCQTLAAKHERRRHHHRRRPEPGTLRIAALVRNSLARRTTGFLSRSLGPSRSSRWS